MATDTANILNDLFLTGAVVTADLQVRSSGWKAQGAPNYEITAGVMGGDRRLLVLDGYVGRLAFEAVAERDGDECPAPAAYCASTPLVAGPPIVEQFYSLTVSGYPSVVDHTVCCNGESWLIEWHDSVADVSYGLELRLLLAQRVGGVGIGPDNLVAAQRLAEFAASLLPVQLLSQ